ncbi:tetratricopeptide repeat protein [Leptospira sp. GIMC2001]|uniref:tetratricopeptide repeat protein n=1 Tax=Leptospira sp. GIMC2001 TaxID=1513297 RepID=UPI00234B67A2|nr:tetratricopeptide repeat protein [Leptospira sp. GIMC2001]WCL48982.1 tetratricopeptide repeat protein [Leptospira sp. GIMC2001]
MGDLNPKKIFNQAVSKESEGNRDAAIQLYQSVLKQDPNFLQAWLNLGSLFFKMDRLDESIKALKAALKIDRRYLQGHLLLAQIYKELDQEKQTEIYLTNAYKIDPKNKFALGALSMFYYDKGLFAESLKMVNQYLNFYPDDKNLKILRTDILAKQGNYKESLNELTELVQKDMSFVAFQNTVKKSLSGEDEIMRKHVDDLAKKTKSKIREFRAKLDLSKENPEDFAPPDPQDAMDLSLLYLFQGDSEKAMKYLVYAKKANEESKKER